MPLSSITDYVNEARTTLQDTVIPYRYSDAELFRALGAAVYEARRLRPDLFPDGTVQDIDENSSGGSAVTMDKMYRKALLYYMLGHVMLREEEEGSQQLARSYLAQFGSQLVSISV